MSKVYLGIIALVSVAATAVGARAAGTSYAPLYQADAVPAAFQTVGDATPCSEDQQVLACVVQLGPNINDRWAYLLNDRSGEPSSHVQFKSRAEGAPCAAMAYPKGHVTVVGGMGDWFTGTLRFACRH